MQFFDIILIALIAVFLVLRLRSVLGERNEDEQNGDQGGGFDDFFNQQRRDTPQQRDEDNVIDLPGMKSPGASMDEEPAVDSAGAWGNPVPNVEYEGALAEGIDAIQAADPNFNPREFLEGGRVAFEMILNAYADGDVKTLKNLLSTDVFGGFAQAIEEREAAGQTLQETLVGITSAELVEAYMDGREAHVTIKFVSEQISALMDADGAVIDGDPAKVMAATDFWTFARNTKSRNPNWTLVGTGSLE